MVYSSRTLSGVASKIEGVIHGSRTNHPPRFTPRIFSPPETQAERPCLKGLIRPVGAPSASEESSAAAAMTVVEILENAIVYEKNLIWSQMTRPFKGTKVALLDSTVQSLPNTRNATPWRRTILHLIHPSRCRLLAVHHRLPLSIPDDLLLAVDQETL